LSTTSVHAEAATTNTRVYANQLAFKDAILRETLERTGVRPPDDIAILSADPWAYRNRIRLAFDIEGRLGYRGRKSHAVVAIRECPIAAPLLLSAAEAAAKSPSARPRKSAPT